MNVEPDSPLPVDGSLLETAAAAPTPEAPAPAAAEAAVASALPPDDAAPPAMTPPMADEPAAEEPAAEAEEVEEEIEEEVVGSAEPLEFIDESIADADLKFDWFILKVQVNREDSIKDALWRRIKMNGLEKYFKEVVVPTEDVAEFTKTGKKRIVKKKLYPGYILINMSVNDDSWFVVRE
ncbi:MAG: transcription termination/antitermination NusG family protein, partial [Pirellulaceae bacterium]|nr:transcription termination/antitermination NusG family protein [Pirellulaceae bacterium]